MRTKVQRLRPLRATGTMTRQQQEVKASRTRLGRHLDVLLTPDQVGVGKPEKWGFHLGAVR